MIKDKNIGSSLEDFLTTDGRLDEAREVAAKRVLSWQIEQAMQEQQITKAEMARRMRTSRSQLERLLDPDNGRVLLETVQRAAVAIGKTLKLELVKRQDM